MVNIGKMKFKLMDFKKIDPIIPKNEPFSLITGTPIILRISREKFSDHKSDFKDFPYFYWKKNFSLDFFISQLENTLIKNMKNIVNIRTKSSQMNMFISLNDSDLKNRFLHKSE